MSETSPSPETGRIKYRKLRITFSAVCGIACLLLIALWWRSYWRIDHLLLPLPLRYAVIIESFPGKTIWHGFHRSAHMNWRFATDSVGDDDGTESHRILNRSWMPYSNPMSIAWVIPYWTVALIIMLQAMLPWIKWRFSLRTLLIGIALMAVLLGLVVWAAK